MKLKNVLITGASGGLANHLVEKIKAENIILLSRNIEPLVEKYKDNSAIHLYECDITDNEQVKTICQNISKRFGALDLLINNAGFGEFKNFINFSYEEIVAMFDVNVLGLMNITKQFLPNMIEQKSGQIINIASMAGKMATAQSSIYSATKFAVVGFSDALRLELKDSNVIVTTVNPGPIKTDFFAKADPSGEYLKKVDFIVLSPDKVAQKIVNVIGKKKREVNLPLAMTFAAKSYQLFPRIGDMLAGGLFNLK